MYKGETFIDGSILRSSMLETFSAMLRPARRIMNISQQELAALSGLDESLIEAVEDSRMTLQRPQYLALAAVFDSVKYKEGEEIYRALLRILTPDASARYSGEYQDFVLVRRWLETFCGIDGSIDSDEVSKEIPELVRADDLPDYASDSGGEENTDCDSDYEDSTEELPGERLPDSELEDIAANCKIIADASAIGDENFPALITRFEPLLRQADAIIIVPQKAIDELREKINTSMNEDEKLNLSDALKYVARKGNEGLLRIRSYDLDGSSTDVIDGVFDKYSKEYDFMLITQDCSVFRNIVSGRENVSAARINDKGDLILWSDEVFGV